MICIIAGGRWGEMTPHALHWLDWLGIKRRSGRSWRPYGKADLAGEAWAAAQGLPVRTFPPDWALHGRAAGPRRNGEMVAAAQAAIVFPGHKGTADLIQQARKRGLRMFLYETPHTPGELDL